MPPKKTTVKNKTLPAKSARVTKKVVSKKTVAVKVATKNNTTLKTKAVATGNLYAYFAEFIGVAILTFVLMLNLAYGEMILQTPIVAALTIAFLVYTLRHLSGAHFNPAVTVGLWVAKVVNYKTAILYILAQLTGAIFAVLVYLQLNFPLMELNPVSAYPYYLFEGLGAFILVFGVLAVATNKVSASMSGAMVGLSLLLGVIIAGNYTLAILNPAIAIGWTILDATYVLAPLVAGILAGGLSRLLSVNATK